MKRAWVLLDRDGTLIVDRHYLASPEQVELLPGAVAGLRRLQELGCGLVMVTNQSGVARGYFTLADVQTVHDHLATLLAEQGVKLDAYYVCPHADEDNCPCRKPRPGLAEQAAREYGIDLSTAFMIGDKRVDLELGRAIGATTILVRTGYGARIAAEVGDLADFIVDDLSAAAEIIERRLVGSSR